MLLATDKNTRSAETELCFFLKSNPLGLLKQHYFSHQDLLVQREWQ